MRFEATEGLNFTLSAGAIAASFALATPHFATSLALGAALESVNLRALHSGARLLFAGTVAGGGAWVALFGTRFALLAAGIWFAMRTGADPVGLVLGLSLVMPATVMAAILHKPPEIPQDPAPPLPPDDPSWERWSVWRAGEVEPAADEDDA